MQTLYSMRRSGNCYKVRLLLHQLAIPHRLVEVDILKGETHTPDYLSKNPNGQVPLLEVGPGRHLPESNAILWYLADRTRLLSNDPIERAATLQWMFFEQHAVLPNIGAAWFWLMLVKGGRELRQHAIEDWFEEGHRALGVLEKHLGGQDFLVDAHYSVADIALYAYTHLAEDCGFDVGGFPAVRAWLDRVQAQPNHLPMDAAPFVLAAE